MLLLCRRKRKCVKTYSRWHSKLIFLNCNLHFGISNHNSFRVLFDKMLPFILFEKCIYILTLEMASWGNCANCIGTVSFFMPPCWCGQWHYLCAVLPRVCGLDISCLSWYDGSLCVCVCVCVVQSLRPHSASSSCSVARRSLKMKTTRHTPCSVRWRNSDRLVKMVRRSGKRSRGISVCMQSVCLVR